MKMNILLTNKEKELLLELKNNNRINIRHKQKKIQKNEKYNDFNNI